jgi:hypothetical protein
LPNHPHDALAGGPINQSGDTIEVVLIQPADNPSVIMIRWPDAPTITTPARYKCGVTGVARRSGEKGRHENHPVESDPER